MPVDRQPPKKQLRASRACTCRQPLPCSLGAGSTATAPCYSRHIDRRIITYVVIYTSEGKLIQINANALVHKVTFATGAASSVNLAPSNLPSARTVSISMCFAHMIVRLNADERCLTMILPECEGILKPQKNSEIDCKICVSNKCTKGRSRYPGETMHHFATTQINTTKVSLRVILVIVPRANEGSRQGIRWNSIKKFQGKHGEHLQQRVQRRLRT
jgi:hypothetical protein